MIELEELIYILQRTKEPKTKLNQTKKNLKELFDNFGTFPGAMFCKQKMQSF